jgi:hypothetical protein
MCLTTITRRILVRTFIVLVVLSMLTTALFADTIVSSNITSSTTWTQSGSPYIIGGNVQIGGTGGVTLSIDPGVVVKFNSNYSLLVGGASSSIYSGALRVNGTADEPVLFTANTDIPSPGFWGSIKYQNYAMDDQCIMDYAVIEYGGNTGGLIYLNTANATFNNCTFRYSLHPGIFPNGGEDYATVNNCCFTGIQTYPLVTYPKWIHSINGNNTFEDNSIQEIKVLSGNVGITQTWRNQAIPYNGHRRGLGHSITQTWRNQAIPYHITGNIDCYGASYVAAILSIESGTVIEFDAGTYLRIASNASATQPGGLNAGGVTFRGENTTAGYWQGITIQRFADSANVSLSNCIIRDGGATTNSNLKFSNYTSGTVYGCTIANSSGYGIYCMDNAYANVSETTFSACNIPVFLYANYAGYLGAGNEYTTNTDNRIELAVDIVTDTQTWINQGIPYLITGDVTVQAAGVPETTVLTIETGTVLDIDPGIQFVIGNASSATYSGGLMADYVTFRVNPSIGGYWNGIRLARFAIPSLCVFNHTIFASAGSTQAGNVVVDSYSGASFNYCTFSGGNNKGLYINDYAEVYVNNCAFNQNNTPVSTAGNFYKNMGTGNTYYQNTNQYIEVREDVIETSATWRNQGVTIRSTGNITVQSQGSGLNTRLTIQYGTIIEFPVGAYMLIGNPSNTNFRGSLEATGVFFKSSTSGPGNWIGIIFEVNSYQSTLSGCIITDAGRSNNRSIYCNAVNPIITGCSIYGGQGTGIYCTDNARPLISGTTITSMSSHPLSMLANDIGSLLPGNNFTGNGVNAIQVRVDTIEENAVWQNPGVPYFLDGNVIIQGTTHPRLEITSGCIIKMPAGNYIQVGSTSNSAYTGALSATNATFTRLGDSGFHNGVLYMANAEPGYNNLIGCTFEYGGNGTYTCNVYVNSSGVEFSDCIFRNSNAYGMKLGSLGFPEVSNCNFTNNTSYPIYLDAGQAGVLGAGNIYNDNNPNRIYVSGNTLTESVSWRNQDIPYEVHGDITVYHTTNPILTLESGCTLLFTANSLLQIGSTSNAIYTGGLCARDVVFNSVSNAPGGWDGIQYNFYADVENSQLENCTIANAGGGTYQCNIRIDRNNINVLRCAVYGSTNIGVLLSGQGCNPRIENCAVTDNQIGILCQNSANPIIGATLGLSNYFDGNAMYAVQNTSANTINATINWWGDSSGPSGEGPGLGDAVSSNVDFASFLAEPLGETPTQFNLLLPANLVTTGELECTFDWQTSVDLSPDDFVLYRVFISTSPTFVPEQTIVHEGLISSQYTAVAGELLDDTRYYWKVDAYDTEMQITHSNQTNWSFYTYVVEPPSAFSLLNPNDDSTVEETSILLSWQQATDPDPGDMVTYTVYLDVVADFQSGTSIQTGETGVYTPYLQPGTLYYWKVVAADTFSQTSESEIYTFYVDEGAGPRAPRFVNIEVLPSGNFNLSWEAVPGTTRYNIYGSDCCDSGFALLGYVSHPVTEYEVVFDPPTPVFKFFFITALDGNRMDYWRKLNGDRLTQ